MLIPFAFFSREQRLACEHCIQQTTLIDEWNQDNGFPIMFLAIEITLEIRGIEFGQRTVGIEHESMIGSG